MIFNIVIFVALIFFGRAIYIGIKTGVLHSTYGEAMTVRKSEGEVGFYFILFLYMAIWIWMAYLLVAEITIFP
jgi:hypothetical protein